MNLPVPDDMAVAVKVMTLKKEVMASVLSAGVRVNDAALRRKETDRVAELLRKVKRAKPQPDVPLDEDERMRKELFS